MAIIGRKIRVRGLVQGVGFRPHVWRLAHEAGLAGQVLNDGEGVEIEAWGETQALDAFLRRLEEEIPPLARIDSLHQTPLAGAAPTGGFAIAESGAGAITTGVVPDAATCPACFTEIMDPADRRYHYPFTNCTHCGPRLSIVRAIPYDRANTSMSAFPMCESCAAEYANPADRRFHAQPNACPDCGPRVWLEDGEGALASDDPIAEVATRLKAGAIVAIKGIGGFHLACDATSTEVVDELRRRKRRGGKPFAVMARDMDEIRRYCAASAEEEALLLSPAAPIILLDNQGAALAPAIAPGQARTGFMLPYTPLHHLLMALLDRPIVLTSGNLSDGPQVIDNDEARRRLAGIADFWLMHDRDIVNRLDDSVMRVDMSGPNILRRARGLAPAPLMLTPAFTDALPVLAMGAELKSTFCFIKDGQAILSQHIGDLEDAETYADYRAALSLYRQLFQFDPEYIAVDRHPDYLSTQWGLALAEETGAHVVEVQHHHAHLAACLAEHGLAPGEERTVGLILDGLGLGADGTVWGGECLIGGYEGFTRAGHFLPVALPGGAQAMKEPWRNTLAHLKAAFGAEWRNAIADTPLGEMLAGKQCDIVERMIDAGLNAPLSSSAGRLFDAVAAAAGICADRQLYEGQAAMELEAAAGPYLAQEAPYPAALSLGGVAVLSWAPLWRALMEDLKQGVQPGRIGARFHLGLAAGLAGMAKAAAEKEGLQRVVLSGGVMQNRILLEALHALLSEAGFDVLTHAQIPANDGGLALGQGVIAACKTLRR